MSSAVLLLIIKAVGDFDQKHIVRNDIEQIPDIVPELKSAVCVVIGPSLRPDKIESRSGDVFPSENQVRTELEEIEIGIAEGIVCDPVQVFVNRVDLFLGTKINPILGKRIEPFRQERSS